MSVKNSTEEERSPIYGLKENTLWYVFYGIIVFMGLALGCEVFNGLMAIREQAIVVG